VQKTRITVDSNTLFAIVDGIKKVLEEAFKAKIEVEIQKAQEVAKKAKTLGQLEEEELRRASDTLEKAKRESLCFIG
jgi:DNA-binding transcriptional regulator GbsR (MarR family)